MINNNLIFDLGAYTGDTFDGFLKEKYEVIAVEAHPGYVKNITETYKKYIANKQLTIINKCISSESNKYITFYISRHPDWCSANKKIAERKDPSVKKISINTITLDNIIKEYGTPYFCKIDIEGNDIIALESLKNIDFEDRPKIISCETECIGNENYTDITGVEIIDKLKDLGYSKFLLIPGKQDKTLDVLTHLDESRMCDYKQIVFYLSILRKTFDFEAPWAFWWDVYAMR